MEERLKVLEADVKMIMRNHLPHIEVEITKLSTQMKVYGGLIIAGITALIIIGLQP
jgi:hypothetical protein